MAYQEFIDRFSKQVALLSYEKGLQLGLAIAKELFPNYQRFFEVHGWGHPGLLAEGIALAELATTKKINPQTAETLAAKVYDVTPETEDFGDVDGSYALNAAVCVVELLNYITDRDSKRLLDIGSLYYETIYFRVKEMGIAVESDIDMHPLMQAARQRLFELAA